MAAVAVFLLIVLILVFLLTSRPKAKGERGEARVAIILDSLPTNEYKIINNLILTNNSNSTQIDHVVISIYGIFVIETKNYKGWIYGGKNAENWTQNIYGKKYYFYNPLRQNQSHISALSYLLKINRDKFISIVAFSSRADIKVKYENVIYISDIRGAIFSFQRQILSIDQVNAIYERLQQITQSPSSEREHVQSVRNNIQEKKQKVSLGICPRCNGKLIIRHGPYGNFYGCSNYPACRFTKKI